MPEQPDVNADSSPATDVTTESSTVAPVETTTSKVEQEKVVPYDRFKEVADEKNFWREQASILANQRQQPSVQQPLEPTDPYVGMDAQTRVFYQEMDKRAEKIAERKIAEKEKGYQSTIDALLLQTAQIQEKLFRNDAKDVVVGSPEEREIANLVRAGLDLEKATWAVMGAKRVESAKTSKQTQHAIKTLEKDKANLDISSMPANHGIPTKDKLNFREDLNRRMQGAGL